MPKRFSRAKQVAALIHRETAEILQHRIFEAKHGLVTISEVVVSPDLSYAKVYLHILEEQEYAAVLRLLDSSKALIRSLLAKKLKLRMMPKLDFLHDHSTIQGFHIEKLLGDNLGKL